MDFKRETMPAPVPQPTGASQQPVQRQVQATTSSANGAKNSKLLIWGGIALLVIVLAAGAFGVWAMNKSNDTTSGATATAAIDKSGYQAVFLTNGQVYFGKLMSLNGPYLILKNIYYLQVAQAIQPGDGKTNAAPANAGSDSNNVQLIKLGNELHGPQDQMQISSNQVLFWENLKTDSKVSKAIDNYKAEPTK